MAAWLNMLPLINASAPQAPSAPSAPEPIAFFAQMDAFQVVGVFVALFIIAFLLGSIPWGVVISRLFYKKDIRDEGSGNIGTTNAFRAMGKVGGCIVFLLDFGKGLLAGFLGAQACSLLGEAGFSDPRLALALVFLGCVWGHIFSPWLGFRGGKGIAVAIGCLFFVFGWQGALIELALFAVLALLTRCVSIGSITAAVACPFIAAYLYWGDPLCIVLFAFAALTVIWAHRANIKRLLAGEENRIGRRE